MPPPDTSVGRVAEETAQPMAGQGSGALPETSRSLEETENERGTISEIDGQAERHLQRDVLDSRLDTTHLAQPVASSDCARAEVELNETGDLEQPEASGAAGHPGNADVESARAGLADGAKLGGGAEAVDNVPHVADENLPPVAEKAAPKNVLPFATRGKSSKSKKSLNSKNKSATRGNSSPVVEAGKGSKGTWQFRLRWNSEKGRPVVYVATVTDAVYELIRSGDFDAYKRQTIASYEARTLSASNKA